MPGQPGEPGVQGLQFDLKQIAVLPRPSTIFWYPAQSHRFLHSASESELISGKLVSPIFALHSARCSARAAAQQRRVHHAQAEDVTRSEASATHQQLDGPLVDVP